VSAKLEKKDLFSVFSQAMKNQEYVEADYLNVITSPMDFSRIKTKLSKNGYKSTKDVRSDFSLIASNSYKYFGEESLIGACALELDKFVNNEFNFLNFSGWSTLLLKYRHRLRALLENPFIPGKGEKIGLDLTKSIKDQLLSHEEILWMESAIRKLTEKEDLEELISIVNTFQPELYNQKKENSPLSSLL
jgi:hypothetical protein